MAKLSLESFNEMLFKAIEPGKHVELIEREIELAYSMKIQKMEEIVEKLNRSEPYHEVLKEVNNIDRSCDELMAQIKKLREGESHETSQE